jgi:uncharacterized paraquat-inducible protein A
MKTRNCAECGKVVDVPDDVEAESRVYCKQRCYCKQYPEMSQRMLKSFENVADGVVIQKNCDFIV